MKALRSVLLTVVLLGLAACGTIQGIKKDLGIGGSNVTSAEALLNDLPSAGNLQSQGAYEAPDFGRFGLVDVGGGVYCPQNIAKQQTKKWGRIGAHPYTGTPEAAIDRFVEVPDSVRQQWKQMIRNTRGINAPLKKGDIMCSMMYSDKVHRRWDKVQANWAERDTLPANAFTVTHGGIDWVLGVPPRQTGGCDNWYWVARAPQRAASAPVQQQQKAAALPSPTQPQKLMPSKTASAEGSYILRARFWEFSSFPAALQQKVVVMVKQGESDATYAFNPGAISRDLNDEIVAAWQKGQATTISKCVEGNLSHPGISKSYRFRSCPGDHNGQRFEKLVYLEQTVPLSMIKDHADPQLIVDVKTPEGCKLVYFNDPQRPERSAWSQLTTRTNKDGENELKKSTNNGSVGMNLNFIFYCPNQKGSV